MTSRVGTKHVKGANRYILRLISRCTPSQTPSGAVGVAYMAGEIARKPHRCYSAVSRTECAVRGWIYLSLSGERRATKSRVWFNCANQEAKRDAMTHHKPLGDNIHDPWDWFLVLGHRRDEQPESGGLTIQQSLTESGHRKIGEDRCALLREARQHRVCSRVNSYVGFQTVPTAKNS